MPRHDGRVAVVTGANSGIGFETTRALARAGALVVMACRSMVRAEAAASALKMDHPPSLLAPMELDLSDLDIVRRFASECRRRFSRIDILVNNAGVMLPPVRRTVQGFEAQIGINHLGHFALTGWLLPSILAAAEARVVTVSSGLHHVSWSDAIEFQEVTRRPRIWFYGQSKLANLLFAFELQRRLADAGLEQRSLAAHPGYSATNLPPRSWLIAAGDRLVAQSAASGALPILFAATSEHAIAGGYFGPDGLFGSRGYPGKAKPSKRAQDAQLAAELWRNSEKATGVTFDFSSAP